MSDLGSDLSALLVRELQTAQREIALFPDDESVWRTVPGITNSAGNLALHLAGNLQHFVGANLGGTGYVRDRAREFGQTSGTRAELHRTLAEAIATVRGVLPTMTDERLAQDYPQPVMDLRVRAGKYLMHLSTHAAFHVGQMGYLRRAVTGDSTSANPVALKDFV